MDALLRTGPGARVAIVAVSLVAAAALAAPAANPRGEPLLYESTSTLVRPQGPTMWTVAVSPDLKSIVTGHGEYGSKGEVRIWDRESGQVKQSLPFDKGVRSVAYSPDGTILAAACFDGALRLYDGSTFALWAVGDESTGGHKSGGINHLAFFKGGQLLATAGWDNKVRVWDVAAAAAKRAAGNPLPLPPVAIFEGHTQRVLAVAGSDDGLTLLSGSVDRTARAWDVPDPLPALGAKPAIVKKERVALGGHSAGVEAIAVSPDGQLLATGSWGGTFLVYNRDGVKTEFTAQFQSGVMCAAFSRDGKFLAAGTGNSVRMKEVRVWDVAAKKEVAYRGDFPEAINGLTFTPDGTTLVLAAANQTVHLWPWAEAKDRQTLTPPGLTFAAQPLYALAVSPANDLIAFAGEGKTISVYHRANAKLVAELTGHDDVVAGLAFSPDGKTLASASYDKTVKLWDAATWKERQTLSGHTGWVLGLAFSPDGRTLATGSYDRTVRLWEVATGTPKATWKDHTAGVRSVAFDADGKRLVSGGSDRIVRVWDVAEGKVLHQLKGHRGAVRAVIFAPDGQTIATGSEDRTVKVWDAATGTETRSFAGLPDMVTALRYSPKGQTLAAATFQGSTAILDPLTGKRRQVLTAHSEAATAAAFADAGQILLTASLDRTVRVWPAIKPSPVAAAQTLAGTIGLVTAAAALPNGNAAVLGGADGSLTLWDLKTGTAAPLFHTPPKLGPIAQVAVSDQLVAAVGADGKFWVVPLAMARDSAWTGTGRFAQFTPDGRHVAISAGRDVVLYDAGTGKEVRKFEAGHDGPILCLAFSPDGKRLATAGEDTKVRLWNAATGERQQAAPALGNYVTIFALAFSPDGSKLAVAANGPDAPPPDDMTGNFQVIRGMYLLPLPATPTEAWAPKDPPRMMHPSGEVTGLAWGTAGRALISTGTDGLVRLWDPQDRRAVQTFRGHEAAISAAAAAPDAGVFLTAGDDLAVCRWRLPGLDPTPGQARLTPPGLTRVWEALPSPDGRYLVAAGEGDKAFRVFTQFPYGVAAEADRYGSAFGIALSPDGRFLVTGHDRGEVVVRDAATGKPLRILTGHTKRVAAIAFAEGGAALVTVGGNRASGKEPGEAFVWDFADGALRHKLDAPAFQWAVESHPSGKSVAIASADGKVRVFDIASGKPLIALGKAGPAAKVVAFSPDGTKIAVGSADQSVRIYTAATGAELRAIPVPDLMVSGVLFSPDGKELVVAAWRGATGLAERPPLIAAYSLAKDGAAPRTFAAHANAVLHLAFLADGRTLVAAGGEAAGFGSIRLYDFPTAKLIGRFTGHRHWAQTVVASKDGTRLASTSWATAVGGEIRLWDARGFRPVAEVKVPGETQYISSGAIDRNGKLLVLGGWGQSLTAWDMTDPAKPVLKKALKAHTAGLRSVAFDTAGTRFVSSDEAGVVKVWDAATLDLIISFKASANAVYRAKFTPDGTAIVTVSGNWQAKAKGELRMWDPKTGKELGRFPDQDRELWDVVFLDGGQRMAAIHTPNGKPDDANVKIWDVATKTVVQTVLPPGTFASARCLAASSDGKYLAVGASTGPVKVVETTTWQDVLSIPELTNCTFRLQFAPGDRDLIAASGDVAAGAVVIRLPWAK